MGFVVESLVSFSLFVLFVAFGGINDLSLDFTLFFSLVSSLFYLLYDFVSNDVKTFPCLLVLSLSWVLLKSNEAVFVVLNCNFWFIYRPSKGLVAVCFFLYTKHAWLAMMVYCVGTEFMSWSENLVISNAERHLLALMFAGLFMQDFSNDTFIAAVPLMVLFAYAGVLCKKQISSAVVFFSGFLGCVGLTFTIVWASSRTNMIVWTWSLLMRLLPFALVSLVILCSGLLLIVLFTEKGIHGLSASEARKLFHVLLLCIFGAPFLLRLNDTYESIVLASLAALCLLLTLEMVRNFSGKHVISKTLSEWFGKWIDSRDSGPIAWTAIYLLLGSFVPFYVTLLFFEKTESSLVVAFSGITSICIGDTCAAITGSRVGRIRWSVHSKKTVEGSLAMFVSMFVFLSLFSKDWYKILSITFAGSIMEAWTVQIDNLFIPLLCMVPAIMRL